MPRPAIDMHSSRTWSAGRDTPAARPIPRTVTTSCQLRKAVKKKRGWGWGRSLTRSCEVMRWEAARWPVWTTGRWGECNGNEVSLCYPYIHYSYVSTSFIIGTCSLLVSLACSHVGLTSTSVAYDAQATTSYRQIIEEIWRYWKRGTEQMNIRKT